MPDFPLKCAKSSFGCGSDPDSTEELTALSRLLADGEGAGCPVPRTPLPLSAIWGLELRPYRFRISGPNPHERLTSLVCIVSLYVRVLL